MLTCTGMKTHRESVTTGISANTNSFKNTGCYFWDFADSDVFWEHSNNSRAKPRAISFADRYPDNISMFRWCNLIVNTCVSDDIQRGYWYQPGCINSVPFQIRTLKFTRAAPGRRRIIIIRPSGSTTEDKWGIAVCQIFAISETAYPPLKQPAIGALDYRNTRIDKRPANISNRLSNPIHRLSVFGLISAIRDSLQIRLTPFDLGYIRIENILLFIDVVSNGVRLLFQSTQ